MPSDTRNRAVRAMTALGVRTRQSAGLRGKRTKPFGRKPGNLDVFTLDPAHLCHFMYYLIFVIILRSTLFIMFMMQGRK